MPDAPQDLEVVGFELHAGAASVALAAAGELETERIGGNGEARGDALDDDREGRSVRFTRGEVTQASHQGSLKGETSALDGLALADREDLAALIERRAGAGNLL